MRIIIEGTQEEVTEALRRLSVGPETAPVTPVVEPDWIPENMPEPEPIGRQIGRDTKACGVDRRCPPIPWDQLPDPKPPKGMKFADRTVEPLSFTMASVTGRK